MGSIESIDLHIIAMIRDQQSKWVSDSLNAKWAILSAISWQEHVVFRWDDNVCFILYQQAKFDFYNDSFDWLVFNVQPAIAQVSNGPLIMSIMLIMSCYTGFFNVRRGWQSLNTGPRFYLRLIRRTGWLWISTSRTTVGRPFKPKKLSVPFLYPGVPAGFIMIAHWNNSAWVDVLPHSDTWSRSNQSLVLFINGACFAEKQQIPIV